MSLFFGNKKIKFNFSGNQVKLILPKIVSNKSLAILGQCELGKAILNSQSTNTNNN